MRARGLRALVLIAWVATIGACAGSLRFNMIPRPERLGEELTIEVETPTAPEARLLSTNGALEFAIVHQARRIPPMLLVVQVVARPSRELARVRVLAAYEVSQVPGRHRLLFGDCRTGLTLRTLDPDVLALVRVTSDTTPQPPRAAWRVRTTKDSIVSVDPATLRCPGGR
jgi:hypothetical protein